ncbi:Signal transduction histidine kinase [Arsukibacterium tuosuense]|uniref:histidine kinase n=1 Tax=Arsukibacterium tuosuense TaxID=1323745 RepID=A0A285I8B2_9GAMM|nr:ATP-binding protein [Arsukibacterium tuosuense]SNY44143.1 Signal transduction histidine kinase [Arsukibacterium tuosuense]
MTKLFLKFYLLIIFGFIGAQLVLSVLLNSVLEREIANDVLTTSKGVSNLIKQQFAGQSQQLWPEILTKLQSQFGYPLTLEPINALSISANASEQLSTLGRTVIADVPIAGQTPVKIITLLSDDTALVQHINGTLENSLPLQLLPIIVWLLSLALFVFLVTYPLYRRLRKLSDIANQVAQGQFNVSFAPFTQKETAELAQAFEQLVTRIKLLLDNQKLFLRIVAHEFRTPLTRVHFALEELKISTNLQKIDEINTDLDELNDMLTELGHYVKINDELERRHQGELHNAKAAIELQLDHLKQTYPNLSISLTWQGPDTLFANTKLNHYCIRNLLANAARFACTSVMVAAINNEAGLQLVIEDNGEGVSDDMLSKLGTPFVRHASKGGLGLGLSIVQNIVHKLDGVLHFSHASPQGLKVQLVIPTFGKPV